MLTPPGLALILGGGVIVLTEPPPPPLPPHVGAVAERGRGQDDRQLWLHGSLLERLGLPARLEHLRDDTPDQLARLGVPHRFVADAIAAGYTVSPPGLAPWLVVRGPAGWRVDVAVPAWADDGLGELAADELERALWIYRATVGTVYRRSPGTSGADLLRRLRRRGYGPSVPPPPSRNGSTEIDLRWVGRPDRERAHVHAYDANARYLASCSSVTVGLGEPEHLIPLAGGGLAFDARTAGYWRARLVPGPDALTWAALGSPSLGDCMDGRWYTTPTLELARDLGLLGEILEAWTWPSASSRLLEPFYRRLRDARAATIATAANPDASAAPAAALQLVKRTYTHTIGGFAGYWRHDGDELYRPDWRHAIIARARVNLYRRIRRLPPTSIPFAVDVDAVWIATDEPDPELAGEALGLGSSPGSFRVIGSAPMRRVDWRGPADAAWRTLRELVH